MSIRRNDRQELAPYAPPAAIGTLLNTAAMVTDVIGIALIHATAGQLSVPATMTPLVNGRRHLSPTLSAFFPA
jgi:hypothetical protein